MTQADAQLLSMIMLVQDILLDDLAHSNHENGSGNGLVPHRRNLQLNAPTHVVGVVRCPPSVEVSLRIWPAELTTDKTSTSRAQQ